MAGSVGGGNLSGGVPKPTNTESVDRHTGFQNFSMELGQRAIQNAEPAPANTARATPIDRGIRLRKIHSRSVSGSVAGAGGGGGASTKVSGRTAGAG